MILLGDEQNFKRTRCQKEGQIYREDWTTVHEIIVQKRKKKEDRKSEEDKEQEYKDEITNDTLNNGTCTYPDVRMSESKSVIFGIFVIYLQLIEQERSNVSNMENIPSTLCTN